MALEGLLQIRESAPASADLSTHQYKIVTFDGSGELALAGAGAGGFVLLDKPNAQGVEGAILLVGKGKVKAGGTISRGDEITSDASGLAVAVAAGAGSNEVVVGIALDSAVSGDLVKFLAVPSTTQG